MKKTIKELKEQLSEVTQFDDPILLDALSDKRKGVIELTIKTQNRIKKEMIKKVDFQCRFKYERELRNKNINIVAGIDEVGRGPLAGPVVACAVILPEDFDLLEVNDSKKLSKSTRESLVPLIKEKAVAIGVGIADNQVIDEYNIYEATKLAMRDALDDLDIKPEHLLIDAMEIDTSIPQTKLIKGDAKSNSIAAASIMAKHYRDEMMKDFSLTYPEYEFEVNVGYGTKKHLEALNQFGPTPIHRKSFSPVSKLINKS
ncbi:ribonuclease HII [Lentilactobacillus laojiaonis]|uniref:ribonuclease HII n=1 Tax=Lentilactobacillus laojiaonis TaxID=2883998 RepID=UPI003222000A